MKHLLTAQVEPYADVLHEMLPLYAGHWRELALDTEQPEAALKPRFDVYMKMADAGDLVTVTLRCNGALVGYFMVVVALGLHYGDCLTAHMDILYVHPGYRARFGSVRLIRCMKRELIRRGVKRWFVNEKIGKSSGLGVIFMLLGFKPVETYYSMWIGN